MRFHEEWKVILNNSVGFPTMRTYKLFICLIECISERMWLKHYGEYWMEGLRKNFVFKICNDIQEAIHAMKYVNQFHSNGDQININSLPWMLTEQQSNVVKQVMQKIKFPSGFCSNMKNIIKKKGDFSGLKTCDCHVFMKVTIMVSI